MGTECQRSSKGDRCSPEAGRSALSNLRLERRPGFNIPIPRGFDRFLGQSPSKAELTRRTELTHQEPNCKVCVSNGGSIPNMSARQLGSSVSLTTDLSHTYLACRARWLRTR